MSTQTRSYLMSMFVSLFFVFVHLSGLIDLGGFAIGIALMAIVFGILAFASSKKDERSTDG